MTFQPSWVRFLQALLLLCVAGFSTNLWADTSEKRQDCIITYTNPRNFQAYVFETTPILPKDTKCIVAFQLLGVLAKPQTTSLHGNVEGWRELVDIVFEVKKRSITDLLVEQRISKAAGEIASEVSKKVMLSEAKLGASNLVIADYSALSKIAPYSNKGRVLTQFLAGNEIYSVNYKYWMNPRSKKDQLVLKELKTLFSSMTFESI